MTLKARFVPAYSASDLAQFRSSWVIDLVGSTTEQTNTSSSDTISSSSAPVLSGATLISIGTTYATPRVTITF